MTPARPQGIAAARFLLLTCALACGLQSATAGVIQDLVSAHHAGNEEAFQTAAAAYRGDPWFLVDDLVSLAKRPTAVHYAELLRYPDAEALRKYASTAEPAKAPWREALVRGQALQRKKDYAGAIDELASLDVTIGHALRARVGIILGTAHYRLDQHEKAREAFARAADQARRLGWLQMELAATSGAATVARRQEDIPARMRLLARRAALQGQVGQEYRAARTKTDLAGAHVRTGDFTMALTLLEEAHAAFVAVGKTGDAVVAAVNVSLVLARRGEIAAARDWLALAEQDLDAADARETYRFSTLRAALRTATGDHAGAAKDLSRLLAAIPEDYPAERASLLAQRSVAERRAGQLGRASQSAQESLALHKKLKDDVGAAHAQRLIAELLIAEGKPRDALTAIAVALPALADDALGAGQAHLLAARAQLALGARALAATALRIAKARFQEVRADDFLADVEHTWALWHVAAGEHAKAFERTLAALAHVDEVVSGLSDESMALSRARRAAMFQTGLEAAFAMNRPARAVELLERWRARSLLDAFGGRTRLRSTRLTPELARAEAHARRDLKGAEQQFASLSRVRGRRPEKREALAAVAEARHALGEARRNIQRSAKRIASLTYPTPLAPSAIQASLTADEALVYVTIAQTSVVSVRVTKTRISKQHVCEASTAEAALKALDQARLSTPKAAQAALDKLAQLIRPALRTPKAIKRVHVCPEGRLSQIPWSSLAKASTVSCIPSGTVLLAMRAQPHKAGKDILAVGSPAYGTHRDRRVPMYFRGRTLQPLPGSKDEVEAITRSDDVVLVDGDATEGKLRASLASHPRWRVVHLACHGLIDMESPTLSALALTADDQDDGFLSVQEILGMEFSADLVVASACDSGVGRTVPGEGVASFARAFMVAGASRVMVSLWRVDDEATAALMKNFHAQLRAGKRAGEALRAAQAAVRKQERWKNPQYWAPWVLWGDGV